MFCSLAFWCSQVQGYLWICCALLTSHTVSHSSGAETECKMGNEMLWGIANIKYFVVFSSEITACCETFLTHEGLGSWGALRAAGSEQGWPRGLLWNPFFTEKEKICSSDGAPETKLPILLIFFNAGKWGRVQRFFIPTSLNYALGWGCSEPFV